MQVLTLALTLLFVLVPASSADVRETTVTATAKLAELGVPMYRLQVDGASASVELLGFEKASLGKVHFAWSVEEGTLIELDRPDAHLLLLHHPMAGKIQLTDLRSQETAVGLLVDEVWQVDGASRALFDLYAEEIALVSEIHDDAFFHHVAVGQRTPGACDFVPGDGPALPPPDSLRSDAQMVTSQDSANDKLEICTPTCGGYQVRGTNLVALSRSACCQAARQDANVKCWNDYCIGCCSFLSCDAFCLVGDYLCAPCGITGTACGGEECQDGPGCNALVSGVSELGMDGEISYQGVGLKIVLDRLETNGDMHHGTAVSYLMGEWAVVSHDRTKSAMSAIVRTSKGMDPVQAVALARSLRTGLDKGAGDVSIAVALPPHEANSRQIALPSLDLRSKALPTGVAEGTVAVRLDFSEDGHLAELEILHDTLGGVSAELTQRLEEAFKLRYQSEKKHRVEIFAVLSVGDELRIDGSLAYLPKCCCGEQFCV